MQFVAAAARVPGTDRLSDGQADLAGLSREAVGRQLLSLIFRPQDDQSLSDMLAVLARDPGNRQAMADLQHQALEAFETDPTIASEAAGVIAAFHRQRADAGDVKALIELGDFLYWDQPEVARAAYQEAIDAGHLHAQIDLAKVLRNVLDDEEGALAVYEEAADSRDADLSAEAMYEIAFVRVFQHDAAAARAMFERVIDTRHPVWTAAAMVGLAGQLERRDPEGAEALYREAAEAGDAEWSAHASWVLGNLLKRKGDAAAAKTAWQRVIDSRSPEWAAPALVHLANLLEDEGDADGLRATYLNGAAAGNPDALYALLHLGQLLEAQGDPVGAHEAWQEAIAAGCEDPGYWRQRMSSAPEPEPEPEVYPPGLPPQFDHANMIRTGIDVLDHGLPPLPGVLTYEMAVPVAYWKAGQCAVVLVLSYSRHGRNEPMPMPMAMEISYSRGADGRWEPPARSVGGSFSHDPIRTPGSMRDLDGNPMVCASSFRADEPRPGHPACVAVGRAAPEIRYLAVTRDGHEDRRPLESHFGAWVVCTEQPGPFEVAGLDANGTVLATLRYPFLPPRW
jgi:tetratricopeptide (TPR) repeat protein